MKKVKTIQLAVSSEELGNITQTNPVPAPTLQDRIVSALRDGMKSYINAGRLMVTAVKTEYHKELGFKGSRAWLETLPNSVADSYNMMAASKVADFAGVSDSYLSEVGKLAVYHLGRAIGEIEKNGLKAPLVGLLAKIRGVENTVAFRAIADFKLANGLKMTELDTQSINGKPEKTATGNGTVTLTGGDKKADKVTELSVRFRGVAFDDAVKVLVHSGIDVNDDKAVERWFGTLIGKLAGKIEAPAAAKASKAKSAKVSDDETESAEDAAYIESDNARIKAMNAVH